jgi:hypothetical protein
VHTPNTKADKQAPAPYACFAAVAEPPWLVADFQERRNRAAMGLPGSRHSVRGVSFEVHLLNSCHGSHQVFICPVVDTKQPLGPIQAQQLANAGPQILHDVQICAIRAPGSDDMELSELLSAFTARPSHPITKLAAGFYSIFNLFSGFMIFKPVSLLTQFTLPFRNPCKL